MTRTRPPFPSTLRPAKWSDIQPTADAAAGVRDDDEVREEWVYKDRQGNEVFRLLGLECGDGRRRCRAVRPTADGGWRPGEGPGPLPLYGLDRLSDGRGAYVVGDEQAADWAAALLDLPAVTSAFGPGGAGRSDWSPLAGRRVVVVPDNDEAGRAYAAEVAAVLLSLAPPARVKVVELPGVPVGADLADFATDRFDRFGFKYDQAKKELEELVLAAAELTGPPPGPAGGAAVLTRLADVAPREVEWLWPGRVALGRLTLLLGDPGRGKSLVALDWAARVSTGAAWPDGRGGAAAGSVVLVGCEDALADTVRPRLDRLGADASRVVALEAVRDGPADAGRAFTLRDAEALDRVIAQTPDVRLVVIDPLSAFLGGRGSPGVAAVRAMLAPLARVAQARRVAVVMVSHLSKGPGSRALYRAGGSLAFVAAARSVWLLGSDPADPGRRLLLPVKNNLGDDSAGLALRVAEGRIAWEAGDVTTAADAALAAEAAPAPRGRRPTQLRAAGSWLADRLAAGPVAVGAAKGPARGTLREQAEKAGLSWGTIRRAFEELGAVSEWSAERKQWRWRLPGDGAGKPAVGAGREGK